MYSILFCFLQVIELISFDYQDGDLVNQKERRSMRRNFDGEEKEIDNLKSCAFIP